MDNVAVYGIGLPPDLQGDALYQHLDQFDIKILNGIASFNKQFLEHFFILSKGKTPKEFKDDLSKMGLISLMIGPTGSLSYLTEEQVEHILTKLGSVDVKEISEDKISLIADEYLEQQFGQGSYGNSQALENQLASASFYLLSVGFSQQEVQKKIAEARQDPKKIDDLFNLEPAQSPEPGGIASHLTGPSGTPPQGPSSQTAQSHEDAPGFEELINGYINQLKEGIEHPPERAARVKELVEEIRGRVKEKFTSRHDEIYVLMHPDRLSRANKQVKSIKRKKERMDLVLDWFALSFLLGNIEFKVEHWQVSSGAGHGQAGVYSAGINFSRYDPIVSDFDDDKLSKVIQIIRKLLQQPSKKAIQKLGQDLVAETGFDEHLYFTD